MPTIKLNPNLWPTRIAAIDGEPHTHGEEIEVDDEEWEELVDRWSTQGGSRMRTWMIVGSDVPPKDATRVRDRDLETLSLQKLKGMADERGLGISGTKKDLADRIREHERDDESP